MEFDVLRKAVAEADIDVYITTSPYGATKCVIDTTRHDNKIKAAEMAWIGFTLLNALKVEKNDKGIEMVKYQDVYDYFDNRKDKKR